MKVINNTALSIRRKERSVKRYVVLFVLFVGVHKLNYLWSEVFGFNIQNALGFTLLVFPLLFLILAYHNAVICKFSNNRIDSFHVKLIIAYVLVLLFFGLILGNHFPKIVDELWTCAIILLSYKLGSLDFVWDLFRRELIFIYLIFAGFVLMGTEFMQEKIVSGEHALEKFEGVSVATEAYNISPILDFWPLIFLLGLYSKDNNTWKKFISFSPFIIYLLFQFFFLKRAPTVRGMTYFVVGALISVRAKKNYSRNVGLILFFITSIFIFFQYLPENLAERFKGEDSSRQEELINMLYNLEIWEIFFGRGLGGEYATGYNAVFERINESGISVKSTLHIGIGDSLLKGGLVLFFVILSHVFLALKFGFTNIGKIGDIGYTATVFLFVFVVFRLIEGGLTPGAIFNAFCFGMSLGALDKLRLNSLQNIKLKYD